MYRGADKSLARPGGKKLGSTSGTRAISTTWRRELSLSSFFLQGKAPKEIHAILTETLACFLLGRAKDLSAPLYVCMYVLRPRYMYICMYLCTFVCMYIGLGICIYMYLCMYICVCMYVHRPRYMYIYLCMYVYVYVCMYVCT